MGRHPTMTKRKHALLLGSLASDRSNTGLRLGSPIDAPGFAGGWVLDQFVLE